MARLTEMLENLSQTSRRRPVQARSRERVELILSKARELIGERGNDAVSMREIASAAGVPISSVYQYFPDKSALLLSIMEEYYDRIHGALREALDPVQTLDELGAALQRAQRRYVDFFRSDPGLINLWAGLQADPQLVRQDIEDSYRNAEYCVKRIRPLLPNVPRAELRSFALFFMHTLGALMRFVMQIEDRDGRAILRESSRLIALRLAELVRRA